MTKDIASFIDSRLGKFKDELDKNSEVWGSTIRIPVALYITKPLRRELKLLTVLGDEKLISFTYKRLPNFCYQSGYLGHLSRQCGFQFQEVFSNPGENTPFGNWLGAMNPQFARGSSSGMPSRANSGIPFANFFGLAAPFNPSTLPLPLVMGNPAAHYESASLELLGVRGPWTLQTLNNLIQKNNLSLVFVAKTKCYSSRIDSLKRKFDMHRICAPSKGKSGALEILWQKIMNVVLQNFSQNHIDVFVQLVEGQMGCSDHFALVICLIDKPVYGARSLHPWRFEAAWLQSDQCLNSTHIVLIPKYKNPEYLTQFRLISLCNVVYKIASKLIANRLKHLLDNVIPSAQSSFVPGRIITDNILLAFELNHFLNSKTTSRQGWMALKLDVSKAYDKVHWSFMEQVISKLGFPRLLFVLSCSVSRRCRIALCYEANILVPLFLRGVSDRATLYLLTFSFFVQSHLVFSFSRLNRWDDSMG
ncbi:hypothetical protein Sango_2770300 [Sesamum angolense]|uniref:Reverse transcriptase domain-containing protein n=1 Tax=Sesamum angolense TaxID=2727404 RepID=A0AAE1T8K9_9LAMI|nr:hypothetical protein Sango_2770300 [Sesamum angolense]